MIIIIVIFEETRRRIVSIIKINVKNKKQKKNQIS